MIGCLTYLFVLLGLCVPAGAVLTSYGIPGRALQHSNQSSDKVPRKRRKWRAATSASVIEMDADSSGVYDLSSFFIILFLTTH